MRPIMRGGPSHLGERPAFASISALAGEITGELHPPGPRMARKRRCSCIQSPVDVTSL